MNINEIAAKVNKNFLRGNRFKVFIPGAPQIVLDNCCAVTYPGISYSTFDWRNAGPPIKLPYEPIFAPCRMSFYCDHNGAVPNWLRAWGRRIMKKNFQIEYFNEYVEDVIVEEKNEQNITVSKCELNNAYPISVDDVELSFENSNQVEKISISLTYEFKRELM